MGLSGTKFYYERAAQFFMKKQSFWYRNSLSLVVFLIFIILISLQAWFGWQEYNRAMFEKGGRLVRFAGYLGTSHFVEATFENWESEFFQMGVYVVFTVFLRQKGSSESKALDRKEEVDREPRAHDKAPWPVRKGGLWLSIYRNSLSLAFLFLFLVSFMLHAIASHREFNKGQMLMHKPGETFGNYLLSSRLWFESMQNWQSEFLAVLSIVLLSVFLRQQGSPESKPVDAAWDETGS
jgi:hypothetical protein